MQGSDFFYSVICLCAQNISLVRICSCFSDQPSSFWHIPPVLEWILDGAEKLLDFTGYYCALKYVRLYVGALSPCTIRTV